MRSGSNSKSRDAKVETESAQTPADREAIGKPTPLAAEGANLVSPAQTDAIESADDDALDPAVLRRVAEAIEREFPLVARRTALVLYDVDPNHLQAQWQVTADDLNRARRVFPAGVPGVRPVLRLMRVTDAGGTEEAAVLHQAPGPGPLEGKARFSVNDYEADFLAELGLLGSEGGWVLLTRSNRVRLPRPVGWRVTRDQEGESARDAVTAPPLPQLRATAAHRAARPALGVQSPLVEQAGTSTTPPIDRTLEAPHRPLEPVFPIAGEGGEPTSSGTGGSREISAGTPAPIARGATAPVFAERSLPPPILPSTVHQWAGEGELLAHYDPTHGLSSRALHGATPAGADVELHAELKIWGRASPGTLVEALGQRLRVGADGRFTLRRPIDDPNAFGIGVSTPTDQDHPETDAG